jgi:di/tricarboxylate transporter
MVYGPGGYRFADFLRAGIPLQIGAGIAACASIPFFFPF